MLKTENRTLIAFYKGWSSHPLSLLKHSAIRLFSLSKYSHCELITSHSEEFGKSICWSSSSKRGGVTVENIDIYPADWDMFEVGVPMSDCVERLKKIEGLKYSYIGAIIATIYSVNKSHSKRWFCSEAIYFALTGRRCRIGIKELHKNLSKLQVKSS